MDNIESLGFAIFRELIAPAVVRDIRAAIEIGLRDQARELVACGELEPEEVEQASDIETGYVFLQKRGVLALGKPIVGNQPRQPVSAAVDALRRHPSVVNIAKRVLGPRIVATPQFAVRAHCPRRRDVCFPWHQDVFFLDLEDKAGARILNFWIPLVQIDTHAGGLEVISGSHQFGVLPHARESAGGDAPSYTGVVPVSLPKGEIVVPELELGDALLMFEKTVHRTRMNYSSRIRWSIDIRYLEAGQPHGRPGEVLVID